MTRISATVQEPRVKVISDDTNRITYPDFAALVVDGDWAPAINAAMAARRFVEVPPADFLVKSQIVTQQEGQAICGMGAPRGNANLSGASRFIYHSSLGATPLFHMKHTAHMNRLAFKGPAKGTGTAVLLRKATTAGEPYEDTDADVSECTFDSWQYPLQHWNRGLRLIDNNFAAASRCVRFEGFDDANFVDSPTNPFDGLPQGYRAIVLDGNRAHGVDIAFENVGLNADKLRGLLCNNNQLDIGDVLWYGGLYSGKFEGNVVDQTSGVPVIGITTPVNCISLIGNDFTGDTVQGIPDRFVDFMGTVTLITATGNTLSLASSFGFYFRQPVLGGTIAGNGFKSIGTPGNSTKACIRTESTFTNLAITGNYFDPLQDAYCIRGAAGQQWAGVTVQGNAWNRSRTLTGIFADGGNNSIQV